MTRSMTSVVFAILATVLLAAAPPAETTSTVPMFDEPDWAQAIQVVGVHAPTQASIVVLRDGARQTVRLLGVTEGGGSAEGAVALHNLIADERLWLAANPRAPNANESDPPRHQVYRHPDGLFVNAEVIRHGHAEADLAHVHSHRRQFSELATLAKQNYRGMHFRGPSQPQPQTRAPEPIPDPGLARGGQATVPPLLGVQAALLKWPTILAITANRPRPATTQIR